MENQNIGKKGTLGKLFMLFSYRDPEPFDWYQRFNGLKDILSQYLTPESKMLNVGSGNSSNVLFKSYS